MRVADAVSRDSAGRIDVNRVLALEILWNYLRDLPRYAKTFKRSAMVNGFSVDFFSAEYRLIVQVAGEDEFELIKILMGSFTEMMLRRLGYRVVSISSEDVLLRCESVLRNISETMGEFQEADSY